MKLIGEYKRIKIYKACCVVTLLKVRNNLMQTILLTKKPKQTKQQKNPSPNSRPVYSNSEDTPVIHN